MRLELRGVRRIHSAVSPLPAVACQALPFLL